MNSVSHLARALGLAACLAFAVVSVHPDLQAAPSKTKKAAVAGKKANATKAASGAKKPATTGQPTIAPQKVMSAEEAAGIIFERQQIMLQLEKDAEQLGMIIAGLAPKDKLAATARAVANGAKDSDLSFKAHVEGGRSKPEIWSKKPDFEQLMQSFVKKTEDMAKLAEAGNFNAALEAAGDAMPCKTCHMTYRAPKKPS